MFSTNRHALRLRHFMMAPAALVAAAVVLSSCTALDNKAAPAKSSTSASAQNSESQAQKTTASEPAAVPKGLETFYQQKPTWEKCERNAAMTCAKVKVPLDYADPSKRSIEIALIKAPATGGGDAGNIVLNPGGPGGSGVSLVADSVAIAVSKNLSAAYNVIGFDPRGVGESTAVKCFANTKAKDDYNAVSNDLGTDSGYAAQIATQTNFAKSCESLSGGIMPYVDTLSSARDLDVIRAVLGDNKLTYLGFSYGTLLGATYAKEFSKNVGKFVLDGAVDPSLDSDGLSRGQALGFEATLRGYLTECLARGGTCPFNGTVDAAMQEITTQLKALDAKPLTTSDPDKRVVTQSIALGTVISPMYRYQYWEDVLDPVFTALKQGDGDVILKVADLFNSREDGKYADNSSEAFIAINCADEQPKESLAVMRAESQKLIKAAPLFGNYLGYNSASCTGWAKEPNPQNAAAALNLTDVPPIVIIGSTGDPSTPHPWSVALQQQIKGSKLITSQSWGHTAYPAASECVEKTVDQYLLQGKVPAGDVTCDGGGPKESVIPQNYKEKYFG